MIGFHVVMPSLAQDSRSFRVRRQDGLPSPPEIQFGGFKPMIPVANNAVFQANSRDSTIVRNPASSFILTGDTRNQQSSINQNNIPVLQNQQQTPFARNFVSRGPPTNNFNNQAVRNVVNFQAADASTVGIIRSNNIPPFNNNRAIPSISNVQRASTQNQQNRPKLASPFQRPQKVVPQRFVKQQPPAVNSQQSQNNLQPQLRLDKQLEEQLRITQLSRRKQSRRNQIQNTNIQQTSKKQSQTRTNISLKQQKQRITGDRANLGAVQRFSLQNAEVSNSGAPRFPNQILPQTRQQPQFRQFDQQKLVRLTPPQLIPTTVRQQPRVDPNQTPRSQNGPNVGSKQQQRLPPQRPQEGKIVKVFNGPPNKIKLTRLRSQSNQQQILKSKQQPIQSKPIKPPKGGRIRFPNQNISVQSSINNGLNRANNQLLPNTPNSGGTSNNLNNFSGVQQVTPSNNNVNLNQIRTGRLIDTVSQSSISINPPAIPARFNAGLLPLQGEVSANGDGANSLPLFPPLGPGRKR